MALFALGMGGGGERGGSKQWDGGGWPPDNFPQLMIHLLTESIHLVCFVCQNIQSRVICQLLLFPKLICTHFVETIFVKLSDKFLFSTKFLLCILAAMPVSDCQSVSEKTSDIDLADCRGELDCDATLSTCSSTPTASPAPVSPSFVGSGRS